MKAPKTASIAQKKLLVEPKRKASTGAKEKKASKNNGAPKRPSGPFFIFMEDFRKSFKESHPDNKSISAVGKAGGDKWKSMSDTDKAPYVAKAAKRKEEYEKVMEVFKKKGAVNAEEDKHEESEKSSSEIHDDAEQEGSSC